MSENRNPKELDVFRKDVGEWNADITITPGLGAPQQKSKGRMTGKLISGGKWLVTDFQNLTTGFEGHGIYGYDRTNKRYVGTWVDDMRSSIHVGHGDWDATTRTMMFEWSTPTPSGQPMSWKEITRMVSPNEQHFRVLFPLPNGGVFEMMTVTYRKVRKTVSALRRLTRRSTRG